MLAISLAQEGAVDFQQHGYLLQRGVLFKDDFHY
jgi:hypothetical protein